jgi:hypothetical protein
VARRWRAYALRAVSAVLAAVLATPAVHPCRRRVQRLGHGVGDLRALDHAGERVGQPLGGLERARQRGGVRRVDRHRRHPRRGGVHRRALERVDPAACSRQEAADEHQIPVAADGAERRRTLEDGFRHVEFFNHDPGRARERAAVAGVTRNGASRCSILGGIGFEVQLDHLKVGPREALQQLAGGLPVEQSRVGIRP